jgi:glycosyltransferase involved in cell wall biosynthesis
VAFRLAVTGENFRQVPTEFAEAEVRLGSHIVQFGFAGQDRYDKLVAEADVVLSSAQHEFFGVSVAEAVAAGAFPILPNRLSYPELIPSQAHATTLYENPKQAVELLAKALTDASHRRYVTGITRPAMEQFSWAVTGPRYDKLVADLR